LQIAHLSISQKVLRFCSVLLYITWRLQYFLYTTANSIPLPVRLYLSWIKQSLALSANGIENNKYYILQWELQFSLCESQLTSTENLHKRCYQKKFDFLPRKSRFPKLNKLAGTFWFPLQERLQKTVIDSISNIVRNRYQSWVFWSCFANIISNFSRYSDYYSLSFNIIDNMDHNMIVFLND